MPCCSKLTREQANKLYVDVLRLNDTKALRRLCREDLFFLFTVACRRKDGDRDWVYARCREVESSPDGCLDLWARGHYKSSLITFAKTIQDILASHGDDPLPEWQRVEATFGIFSHTRPIAKGFLEQIKRELEANTFLQKLFPDVLYEFPKKEAPKWALDSGIIVKRRSNPKEATVEAWGLVDGQPTSKHFTVLEYDDVVTLESVSTPDQIEKTTAALKVSYNLGSEGGRRRFIGTRYHFNDTYRELIERETVKPRIHPATDDGTMDGEPVLLSKDELAEKRKDMGPYVSACQLFLNPKEDSVMGFSEQWCRHYDRLRNIAEWNHYVLIDPANEKKKENDYTVIVDIALAPDRNYYLIDGIRDRLSLTERTNKLFEFHRKYRPIKVGYEKYGKDADIEHVQYVMEQENYRFEIQAVGGQMAKNDRIRRLVPICEQGRWWMPHTLLYRNYEDRVMDFIAQFLKDEFLAFPVAVHDDMLDCCARILDPALGAVFPDPINHAAPSITIPVESENRCQTDYALFD